MGATNRFVVVGAGLAGARAAIALRNEGFAGSLTLLGAEPVPPYDRVPLSKQYLRGAPGGHTLFVRDADYYQQHGIELRLDASVAALDVTDRQVTLASGERLGYDAVLLATGASARRLPIPGADLDGVYYLRTLADAGRLRNVLKAASRLVVIGGGWIGCEVAASARQLGVDVAMVGRAGLPLERVLGPELGRFYRELHADHGVELHLGVQVVALRGHPTVEEVELSDGQILPADAVVAGIGASPRVELAQAAGLALDDGILTDEHLATNVPDIFAAGDVARAWHPRLARRIRLEHWSAALEQGPVAARNMLGIATVYDRVPFFFSDQYDVGMEYSGFATDWDQVIFRGNPADRKFIAFWLKGGRLVAGMNVNIWNVADTIAALVSARHPVDAAALADPAVDLAVLAAETRAAPHPGA